MNYNDDPRGGVRVGEVAAIFGGLLLSDYSAAVPLFFAHLVFSGAGLRPAILGFPL